MSVVRWAARLRRTLAFGAVGLPTGGGDPQIADCSAVNSRHCSVKETICVYLRDLRFLREWICDAFVSLCLRVCDGSVPLCLCGCPGERSSLPVDHQVVEGAVEDGAEAFVEDSFDLAQPVAP